MRVALAIALILHHAIPAGLSLVTLLALNPFQVQAASRVMNFQGRLTNTSNNPQTGPFDFKFRLFDAPSGGNQLWPTGGGTEDQTLPVTNGVFSAQVGSVTPIPLSAFQVADGTDVYLEIQVQGETMSPRQKMLSVPYAMTLMGRTTDHFLDVSGSTQTKTGGLNVTGGNVGIGTVNPAFKMEVNGSIKASALYSGNYYFTTAGADMVFAPGGSEAGRFVAATKGFAAQGGISASSITLSGITADSAAAAGSLAYRSDLGQLRFRTNEGWVAVSTGSVAGGTVDVSGSTQTKAGGLNVSGNIGIGTSAPVAKLSMDLDSALGSQNAIGDGIVIRSGNTANGIEVRHGSSTGFLAMNANQAGSGALGMGTKGNFPIYFYTNAGVSAGTPSASGIVMTITSGSNIGAGTTAPTSKFDVLDGSITVRGTNSGIAIGGPATLGSLTAGGVRVVTGGALVGTIHPSIQNGSINITDDSTLASRGITIANGGLLGVNTATPAGLFQVAGGTLTALSNGNVGVGTTAPANRLHIKGSGTDGISLERSAASQETELKFKNEVGADVWTMHMDGSAPEGLFIYPSAATRHLIFQVNEAGTAYGNVGIGSVAPAAKLDVASGSGNFAMRVSSGTSLGYSGGLVGIGTLNPVALLDLVTPHPATNANGIRMTAATLDFRMYPETKSVGAGYLGTESTHSLRFFTNGTANVRMTFDTNGYVGIGTTAPGGILDVKFNSESQGATFFRDASTDGVGRSMIWFYRNGANVGSISTNGSATTYSTTSDVRLKENIVPSSKGLSDLMKVQVSDFNFISDPLKTRQTGFLAQQLNEVFPEAVTRPAKPENNWNVDYGRVTPLIVSGVQELNGKVEALKAENEELKSRIRRLEERLSAK